MSGPQNSATGDMGDGDGETTDVGNYTRLSEKDKAVLCNALCKCNIIGQSSKGGTKVLRQTCVAQRLNLANTVSMDTIGSPTEYRPEVPYDMSPVPPAPPVPIMSDNFPLEPHESIRSWISDAWPGGMKGYSTGKKAGNEQIRRPDVVIVNDPTQAPIQSNIKTVVEMKFNDAFSRNQKAAYIRIAGSSKKFVSLSPMDCCCPNEEQERKASRSSQADSDVEDAFGSSASGNVPPLSPLPPMPPGLAFP